MKFQTLNLSPWTWSGQNVLHSRYYVPASGEGGEGGGSLPSLKKCCRKEEYLHSRIPATFLRMIKNHIWSNKVSLVGLGRDLTALGSRPVQCNWLATRTTISLQWRNDQPDRTLITWWFPKRSEEICESLAKSGETFLCLSTHLLAPWLRMSGPEPLLPPVFLQGENRDSSLLYIHFLSVSLCIHFEAFHTVHSCSQSLL